MKARVKKTVRDLDEDEDNEDEKGDDQPVQRAEANMKKKKAEDVEDTNIKAPHLMLSL